MSPRAVEGAALFAYELPLRRPLAGAPVRRGLVVALEAGGARGFGEVAPWSGLHDETVEDCARLLADLLPALIGERVPEPGRSWRPPRLVDDAAPVLAWGVTAALLDLSAALEGRPLCQLLSATAPSVASVAALVLDDEDLARPLGDRPAVKVKVRSPGDLARLVRVREQLPEAELRVDANRALSLEEALAFARAAAPLDVAFFEEPVAGASLAPLMKAGVKVALDEALREPELDPVLLSRARALVLKPSVLGPGRTLALLEEPGVKVLSSPFESAVGRSALAHLQAAFCPAVAAGLGTAAFLASDLAPLDESEGRLDLSVRPTWDDSKLTQLSKWGRS